MKPNKRFYFILHETYSRIGILHVGDLCIARLGELSS
jgi:hypothetical protein